MTQSYKIKRETGWKPNYTLKTITFPFQPNHKKYSRRKYLIILFYEVAGVLKQKKVYFGFKSEGNRAKKGFKSKRKDTDDKFSARYWEQLLIDGQPNFKKAFEKLLDREI